VRPKKSLSNETIKDLPQYKAAVKYQAYLEEMQLALMTYYTDLSTSFIQKFSAYANSNPTVILACTYGGIIGGFIMIFLFEVLFLSCRGKRVFRGFINSIWWICSISAVLVAIFLNFMVPVIGSMSELGVIMQPTMYNRTFFAKLEFPNDMVKGHMYPCIFGSKIF
jgi:hypothetical protein